jgi:hypothetical protein
VVLYGCESWSLTSREEHRLRVFENRVPRSIFGLKRGEMIGGWRKLHNEEVHNLYSSPSIIRMKKSRRIKWAGLVVSMGKKRNTCRILVAKPEEKRPWEDVDVGGRMTLKQILERQDWTDLAQDRDQWRTCEPPGSIKCYEVLE